MRKSGTGNADLYSFEMYVPSVRDVSLQSEIDGLVEAVVDKVRMVLSRNHSVNFYPTKSLKVLPLSYNRSW